MTRRHFKGYLLFVGGWIAAVLLFALIRFVGLPSAPQFRGLDFDQIDHSQILVEALLLGWVLGSVFYGLDRALDRPEIRRQPYGVLIFVQTIGNLGLVLLAQVCVAVFDVVPGNQGFQWSLIQNRVNSSNFLVALIYVTITSFLFSFLKQIDHKFGPGNLWKLIIGMYHHPREEERIFMFLDLKGSTAQAERLGHVQFSRLIQDCFIDLSVVIDLQAQIYQYVGDEVILFWEVEAGLRQANCLRAYFQFADRLKDRADHYLSEYQVAPIFKAGANIGSATVLEVGEIKREISYLGDVLNTAARIQGKCNDLGANLLVSETLLQRLEPIPADLNAESIGEVELRGREKHVRVFSIHCNGHRRPADPGRKTVEC